MNENQEVNNAPQVKPECKVADEQLEKVAAGWHTFFKSAIDANMPFPAAQGEVVTTKQGDMLEIIVGAANVKRM